MTRGEHSYELTNVHIFPHQSDWAINDDDIISKGMDKTMFWYQLKLPKYPFIYTEISTNILEQIGYSSILHVINY